MVAHGLRYYRPDEQHPERIRAEDGSENADLTAAAIHGALRAFILDPHYPCVGAKSAINLGSYRLGVFSSLGDADGVAPALTTFVSEAAELPFATFIAVFESPLDVTPEEFEPLLWRQLQRLHDLDAAQWAPDVSSDPNDPHFSFSFAGAAFFVVGLHPKSERLSRRFPWPALVFNPHAQFEKLRAEQKWERMQQVIRNKDEALQGDINPVLRDFGEQSEARQYSGRAPEDDWEAPFDPTPPKCPFGHGQ